MQGAPCRFRPGNKVFYNRYDGPPVKGTVVSVNTSTTYGGPLCASHGLLTLGHTSRAFGELKPGVC